VKARQLLLIAILSMIGCAVAGCGESVPVNPTSVNGSNPHVEGSPEDRIKAIEADTSLDPAERARRIAVVKERNHLK